MNQLSFVCRDRYCRSVVHYYFVVIVVFFFVAPQYSLSLDRPSDSDLVDNSKVTHWVSEKDQHWEQYSDDPDGDPLGTRRRCGGGGRIFVGTNVGAGVGNEVGAQAVGHRHWESVWVVPFESALGTSVGGAVVGDALKNLLGEVVGPPLGRTTT